MENKELCLEEMPSRIEVNTVFGPSSGEQNAAHEIQLLRGVTERYMVRERERERERDEREAHLVEDFSWLVKDERNYACTGCLDEPDVRGCDVRRVRRIAESAGGAVARMSENSDHGPVIKRRIQRGTSLSAMRRRQPVLMKFLSSS